MATNGQVIATGEGYKTKASAIEGIELVQKNAPGAKIEDLSEVSSASGGGVLPKGTSEFPPGATAGSLAAGSGAAGKVP